MAIPNINDYNTWDGNVFTHPDIDGNSQKTIDFLTTNYDVTFNSVTASEYVGIPSDQFSTITAGENLSAGDVVRISSGQAFKADNSTSAGITAVVGVCNTTVSSGGTVKIDYGFYNGFSSLTVGTMYYVGTSGGITSTKPSINVLEIGQAVSTTRINLYFNNKRPTFSGLTTLQNAGGTVLGHKVFTFNTPGITTTKYKIFEGNTGSNRLGMLVLVNQYGSGTNAAFGGVNHVSINNTVGSYSVTNVVNDSFLEVGFQGSDLYLVVPGGGLFYFQVTLIINGYYIGGLLEPSQMGFI